MTTEQKARQLALTLVGEDQNPEPRYHGGISCMDLGAFKMPLPFPEIGKKWAARWYDTPSGELLPELQQVPLDEPNSEWKEGYPKYDS